MTHSEIKGEILLEVYLTTTLLDVDVLTTLNWAAIFSIASLSLIAPLLVIYCPLLPSLPSFIYLPHLLLKTLQLLSPPLFFYLKSPLFQRPTLAPSLALQISTEPDVYAFLCIDLSIFNGPALPGAGTILCMFRWTSDAVRACCHSMLLRARAGDLGSALRVFPGDTDLRQAWTHMTMRAQSICLWRHLRTLNK